MKKLTLILTVCAIAAAVTLAPQDAQAKNKTEVTTFATATTNSTVVLAETGAFDGEYAKYDSVCVSTPSHQTGTVAIAADRAGYLQTLLTLFLTNTTASATVTNVDMSDIPVNGRLRFTFKQSGASTNVWSAISFFDGLNN